MTKLAFSAILLLFLYGQTASVSAQPEKNIPAGKKVPKIFKVHTNGKRITIQAKEDLKTLIVWTTSGHRILELKNINAPTYTFQVTVKENIFFILVETVSGKRDTEKIGIK